MEQKASSGEEGPRIGGGDAGGQGSARAEVVSAYGIGAAPTRRSGLFGLGEAC